MELVKKPLCTRIPSITTKIYYGERVSKKTLLRKKAGQNSVLLPAWQGQMEMHSIHAGMSRIEVT